MTNDELKQILDGIAAKEDGNLRPETVVEEARDPAHPLHARFEWDNEKAAHSHRLDQARAIIRSVKYVVTIETRRVESVYYVQNPDRETGRAAGYCALPRIVGEREASIRAMSFEFERIEAMLKRARDLAANLEMETHAQLATNMLRTLGENEIPREVEIREEEETG